MTATLTNIPYHQHGNFGFQFATNTTASARKIIGYNLADKTEATSSTSDNVIDLNPIKSIYIDFQADVRKDIEFSNNVVSLAINDTSDFGSIVRYKLNENYHQKLKFHYEKEVKFRFYDQDFNNINLNGTDWYLTIKIDETEVEEGHKIIKIDQIINFNDLYSATLFLFLIDLNSAIPALSLLKRCKLLLSYIFSP